MHISAFSGVRLAACLAVAAGLVACGSSDGTADRRRGDSSTAVATGSRPSIANDAAAANQGDPRIVVLGDSLTAGLGLRAEDAYPAVLQRRLDAEGLKYHVINAGNSGDTSAAGLSRLDWALDGNVRILIVALGGNDALRGLPIPQLKSNLARIIERAQARGVSVVLAGMEAPPNWGDEYTTAFHEVYPTLAKEYRVALVPFLLEGVAGIDRLNQRDGIHPTAEGDRMVADTVWKVLQPVVAARAAGERPTGVPKS
ncbi:MAG TPA: arylesterase [Vicinamibacterales bacterium]|jgi:acyl-CoA thioesterase-1